MPLKTTVIGAWPKPEYLKLGDWFQSGQSKLDFEKKKLEIEETKPTFVLSTFKTDTTKLGLFFLTKLLREGNQL